MKVKFTCQALDDLDGIASFIGRDNFPAACKVVSTLKRLSGRLADSPEAGLETDISDLYVLVTPRIPYLIFYRRENDQIEIVHFRHTARDRSRGWRP